MPIDSNRINRHQAKISMALHQGHSPTLAVFDTCRLDNFGVRPLPSQTLAKPQGIVAFIPAAGASSRYLEPLQPFYACLANNDLEGMKDQLSQLRAKGAELWLLPAKFRELLLQSKDLGTVDHRSIDQLQDLMSWPKAWLPCTLENDSFLRLKLEEHQQLGRLLGSGCIGQVFVVQEEWQAAFEQRLAEYQYDLPQLVLVQGEQQSTVRFDHHAQPVRDDLGEFSIVPGGHGTLVSLFSQVQARWPEARSLFIRNIDNIMGVSPQAIELTLQFLAAHEAILSAVTLIRRGLDQNQHAPLEQQIQNAALRLCQLAGDSPLSSEEQTWLSNCEPQYRDLWRAQMVLFSMNIPLIHSLENTDSLNRATLKALFDRPVTTLGQVPNSGHDFGGTPVFAQMYGQKTKICLECPHISGADQERFLTATKATHFNPVFVAAELPFGNQDYEDGNDELWIMAQKSFRGQTVYYHETVLYERLGNNRTANCTFYEVPRLLFNPHKSVADLAIHSRTRWGLSAGNES